MGKRNKFQKKRDGPNRKARLCIRNLPFKTTEEKLREHFSKFGDITEINLLRRGDGNLVGCGFIQFVAVQQASKALYNASGKPFMGRDIIIDWAVPKDKFVQNMNAEVKDEIKEEVNEEEFQFAPSGDSQVLGESIEIKDEEIKTENDSDDVNKKVDSEGASNDEVSVEDVKEESDEDDTKSDIKSEDDEVEVLSQISETEKRTKVISNDVAEGRTVFVKNVPFMATNEDLKACMQQFGRVFYALVCKDQYTEHSKGTAFVKFVNKEDAEKCLQAGTELTLLGNILDCYPALDKKSINQKKEVKNVKEKDSRNLYLIKEGVILAGSSAAKDVSKSDMDKRLQLEKWKSQILRNLHMYVSRVRLVIHNLPSSWDDKKLRTLVVKYAGPKAVITEAKVMRDMRNTDAKGVGLSKEYGFVSFTSHENALTALRSLNNNPNVFTAQRRPIVAFSIENRVMVNAKQKRMQKSRERNPNNANYKPAETEEVKPEPPKGKKRKFDQVEQSTKFMGVAAKPGIPKMRSNYKLKVQAQTHFENVKKLKKSKRAKNILNLQKQRTKQEKQKMNTPKQKKQKDVDNFSKIVNKYKDNLIANPFKKSKWYD